MWDAWNRKHIAKHRVTVYEVEEGWKNPLLNVVTRLDRVLIVSRLTSGRLLAIFVSYEKQQRPYVVSARDAGRKERRILYEKTKTN